MECVQCTAFIYLIDLLHLCVTAFYNHLTIGLRQTYILSSKKRKWSRRWQLDALCTDLALWNLSFSSSATKPRCRSNNWEIIWGGCCQVANTISCKYSLGIYLVFNNNLQFLYSVKIIKFILKFKYFPMLFILLFISVVILKFRSLFFIVITFYLTLAIMEKAI